MKWWSILKNAKISGKAKGSSIDIRRLNFEEKEEIKHKKKKPEDCFPPLFELFRNFMKIQNTIDPSKTLISNWEHGLTEEELCTLKYTSKYVMIPWKEGRTFEKRKTVRFTLEAKGLFVEFLIVMALNGADEKNKEDYGNMYCKFEVKCMRTSAIDTYPTSNRPVISEFFWDIYPTPQLGEELRNFRLSLESFDNQMQEYAKSNGQILVNGIDIEKWVGTMATEVYESFDKYY